MTLVVALRAGPGIGVACADRQITYALPSYERKFEGKERKIVHLRDSYFVGFASEIDPGIPEDIIYEAKRKIGELQIPTFQNVLEIIKQVYEAKREGLVHPYVAKSVGVKWEDYVAKRLRRGLDKEVRARLKSEREDPKVFDTDLIICGLDEKPLGGRPSDFSIYTYRSDGSEHPDKHSDSIGSGSDTADIVTSEFLESVPARKSDLGLARSAYVVMEARRRAAERNLGVGRRSQLVWIDGEGNFNETNENQTAFLNAVVELRHRRPKQISDDAVQTFFEAMVVPVDRREHAYEKGLTDLMKLVPLNKNIYRLLVEMAN